MFDTGTGPGKFVTLIVATDGSTITIVGGTEFSPSSLPPLTGTIDADGNFTVSGSGLIAGVSNVSVTGEGLLTDAGVVIEFTVGGDGNLPGGEPIQYVVTATLYGATNRPRSANR